jgi:hypothetical protein
MTPTRSQWRAAIHYVRAQLRIMVPGRKPQRHAEYRRLVRQCAELAAKATR